MNNMTTEQKARAYDEAKYIMKEYLESGNAGVIAENTIKKAFHELIESEDERIRKAMINGFNKLDKSAVWYNGITNGQILAWLEKQGEFKNIDSDDLATLETWEDAVKENKEKWQLSDWFVEATSLLIQKVKRIENNESINIKGSKVMLNACINALRAVGHSHLSDWLEKQGERKSDWSEDDTQYINDTLALLSFGCSIHSVGEVQEWLQSLSNRVQLKQEWSEEDKEILDGIIVDVEVLKEQDKTKTGKAAYQREIDWLKFLRPQNNITDKELINARNEAYNDALDKIEYHSGEPTFDDGWDAAIWYLKKRIEKFVQ